MLNKGYVRFKIVFFEIQMAASLTLSFLSLAKLLLLPEIRFKDFQDKIIPEADQNL